MWSDLQCLFLIILKISYILDWDLNLGFHLCELYTNNYIFPESILSNIMFHAPMGIFQLELIYYFTYFSTVVPSNSSVFISCRSFGVNTTFSTGLVGVEVDPAS